MMTLAIENYLVFSAMYILLSWAIYLPYRCGQLYLAPIYCMAAGGYFSAYTATTWGWPVGASMVSSPLVGAIFAFFPALVLRKAPGFATAIASIALVIILQTVIMNLDFLGGQAGFFGIPPMAGLLPITLGILVVCGLFVYRIDNSRIGRAAEMLFYNRDMAATFGVSMSSISVFLQVFSGGLSGLAGAIFAFTVGAIFPDAFGFSILINVAVMVFVGGTLTMWGAVVFGPLLWGIPLILPKMVAEWREIIYGGLLIIILIWKPEGVIGKSTVQDIKKCFGRLFFLARSTSE